MIKGVIFDLDNTLEEWLPHEAAVEAEFAQRLADKHSIDPDQFVKVFDHIKISYLHSRSLPQDYGRDMWFSETLAHFGIYEEDIPSLVEHYWEDLLGRVKLFPGAMDVLEELKQDYKLGLLSDSDGARYYKEQRIKRLRIGRFFDAILTSDDIGANKPHPRCFLEAAERLGVRPEECVMVGDHPEVDLVMAKELGMTTVWTREGVDEEHRAREYDYVDHVVDSVVQVPRVVEVCDVVATTP